jgi:hypothetical protein
MESDNTATTREIGIFMVRFGIDGGDEEGGKWRGPKERRWLYGHDSY